MATYPKLLYIDDIPTPYRVGVQKRAAELWAGSFKVFFCAPSEPGRNWTLDIRNLDHLVLRGWQWRPPGQANPYSFKYNPNVIGELENYHPDVVVLSGYAHPTMMRAAAWCRQRNVPYGISCETSARSTATSGLRWNLRKFAIGWMIRGMSFGLPVGREAASYLGKLGAHGTPMFFFPNTPDTRPFISASNQLDSDIELQRRVRKRYNLLDQGPVFIFVGRMIQAKRPLDALIAFQKLGSNIQANLLFVGDGELMKALEYAAAGDRRILFSGWISDQNELARLFALATALVLPSQHEPWGAVVNEAMAAGTPVIASDQVGAANEMIRHLVDGFVVPVGDISSITEMMAMLISGDSRNSRISRNARMTAISYGEEFAANNLVQGAVAAVGELSKSGI